MKDYTKLINDLIDFAEWAEANIYEVPINLPDTLRDAEDALKKDDDNGKKN